VVAAAEDDATQDGKAVQETEVSAETTAAASDAIGLLDVSYAVKNYPRFLDSIAEMKRDVEEAEEEVKHQKSKLDNLTAQLAIHPVGTEEHNTLEDRITALKNELTSSVARQKRDFVQREAKIYYDAYKDIVEQSEQYARQHGIVMVLRFSGDEVNVNDPKSILQHINAPIVWYDEDRDITKAVLQRLTERSKKKAAETKETEPGDAASDAAEPAPVVTE